jgi:hypothetical protein
MDPSALNEALLERTGGQVGLHQVVEAYAQAIRDSAGILDLPLSGVDADGTTGRISILLPEQPLSITWTPVTGWGWDTGGGTRYRVTREADAAGIVPSPETVAAWIQVISTGDRSGHVDPPEELAAEDGALLDLLVSYGTGYA